jgi:thiol-disulfide isomerase/thioredoxin
MKQFLYNLALFTVLAIAFSSLGGCSGSSTGNADTASVNSNAANTETSISENSTYPMLAANVANAQFEMLDGAKQTIADRKGKVVLVNLWATWCGPCIGEMPHLIELQNKYRDQGFEIVGLSIGADANTDEQESIPDIEEFATKQKLNYDLGRSPRPTTNEFQRLARFNGIPLSILVSRDGRLRAVLRGGGPAGIQQMRESVDRIMAE